MQEFDSNGTKVIIGGRQTGKTIALVQWAQGDPGRVVVCSSQARADQLRRMGLTAEQAVPYAHATNFLRGRHLEVAVDDVLDYIYADLGTFPAVATIDAVPIAPETAETPAELRAEAVQYLKDENARLRTLNYALLQIAQTNAGVSCDGRCVSGADVGVPEVGGIAYPDPECSLHGDEATQLEALRVAIAAVSA